MGRSEEKKLNLESSLRELVDQSAIIYENGGMPELEPWLINYYSPNEYLQGCARYILKIMVSARQRVSTGIYSIYPELKEKIIQHCLSSNEFTKD